MNTQPDAQNQGQWIDATEAARRLGISARAVQKRCAAGKTTARRITTPQGVRWELDARELGREPANQTNEQGANQRTEGHEVGSFDPQNNTNRHANQRTERREPTNQANTQDDDLRELLARERENAAFLRGVIEQLQRDAIELRAIARDALKVAPRQIAQGTDETARDAPELAKKSESVNHLGDAQTGKNRGEAPVSYGSIADELERMLNQ